MRYVTQKGYTIYKGVVHIMNFCHEFEQINRMIFPDADFPCVREKLQAVFDEIILSDCTCKEILLKSAFFLLRKINNLDFPEKPCKYKCNLTQLAENLVFCCDAVLCESEKRLIFLTDSDDIFTLADPKLITRAILNAVSNSVKYSHGDYIGICLERIGDRAVFSFESSGDFPIDNYFHSLDGRGGLNFISKTAKFYNGCMLMNSDGEKTSFLFSIPIVNADDFPEYRTPDIDELLFDRLGVIYEALY